MNNLLKLVKTSIIITFCIQFVDMLFSIGKPMTWQGELRDILIHFMFAFPLTLVNGYYHDFLTLRYTWEKQPKKRLWFGAIGSIIITMITLVIIRLVLLVGIYNKPFDKFIEDEKLEYYLIGFFITLIVSLFLHAFHFYKELQNRKITEQKIIAGTASAKFTALKNQLDPHFLFNSLNVLTSLIEENPRMAQKFTTSLSKVYRYVLEQKDKELVTVNEELKFAKTYMTLIKLRFEDSIIFDMPESAENPEAKVVPLSLQILLENTIKHNIVTPKRPLHIKIYEKDDFLLVENNLQPKEVIKQSSGVGLGNVQQRYGLLTKRKFSVYKTENKFIAELPILTKQVKSSKMESIQYIEEAKNLKYSRAKDQVKKIKEFYINLIWYCIVIPFLIFINYKTNQFGFAWVFFPMIGWGIGIAFHAMDAFNYHPILGRDWEKKKIKKYMDESQK
ncbi:2TM domain-containing protein [Aquimarina pacifica]|uniref:2TM domain-containing protein n=1 Tax=Aquimarina pacifica TaxID=1296415 RepID=UPI0004726910|nr:2TM domain-containing protein [Aquimarina pacifica]